MEIKVTIEAPAIAEAINNLAAAIAEKNSIVTYINSTTIPEIKMPDSINEPSINKDVPATIPLAEHRNIRSNKLWQLEQHLWMQEKQLS